MKQGRTLFLGEFIHLIEHAKTSAIRDAQVLEDFVYFFILLRVTRVGGVRNVQNQRGFLNLFERRAKSGQQALGQVADESDGIRQQYAAVRGQANRANGGVER